MSTYTGSELDDNISIFETVTYGLGGNDIFGGNSSDQEFYGGTGNDVIFGGIFLTQLGSGTLSSPRVLTSFNVSGIDWLYGDEGTDTLYGADGNDYLYGGSGNDSGIVFNQGLYWLAGLRGGDGNDQLFGEAGNDDLFGDANDDILDGGSGNDGLRGGAGLDKLYGGTGNDTLDGEAGSDTLFGGSGLDRMSGGADADKLYGEGDADFLYGDDGADLLVGGLGADTLRGGLGADKFQFNSTSEKGDIIRDFASDDFLTFKKSAFGNLTLGTLSSAAYRENTTGLAGDSSDRFIYELDTGELYYDSNGNASGGSVLIATLDNEFNISRADILIV